MEKVRFECTCGDVLQVTSGPIQCQQCGKEWQEQQWQQRKKTGLVIPEEHQAEALDAPLNPPLTRGSLQVTKMLNQNEIMEIKEASMRENESAPAPKENEPAPEETSRPEKKVPKEIEPTIMFSTDEIEKIKQASLEEKEKEKGNEE